MTRSSERIPRWLFAAAALAMVALYLVCSVRVHRDPRPLGTPADLGALAARSDLNILFILVDTLRADRLGAYGYERDTSPRLDALAASGIRFDDHLAQSSWTKSSMASLWTAVYPVRTRVLRYSDAIAPEARMPAEILRDAGFLTAAIWRNGWVAPNFGFAQGFDSYHNPPPSPLPPSLRRENPTLKEPASDSDIIRSALQFMQSYPDRRWLLYLHLMDVHQYVYDEESALFGTTYSDAYDNSIRRTDRNIGTLIDALEQSGQRSRTLVVVASDHGEAFREHGIEGHARDLFSPVTRTPWIVSLPFRLEPGLVVETPTENVDVWPTLLGLLGLPALEGADGRSRVPELTHSASAPSNGAPARFAAIDRNWGQVTRRPGLVVAVTEGRYRLVQQVDPPKKALLFDLESDPGERHDLSQEKPEIAARLEERVREHVARAPAWQGGAPQVQLDEMNLKQLRALGYVLE